MDADLMVCMAFVWCSRRLSSMPCIFCLYQVYVLRYVNFVLRHFIHIIAGRAGRKGDALGLQGCTVPKHDGNDGYNSDRVTRLQVSLKQKGFV